jgi:hypothetical protein
MNEGDEEEYREREDLTDDCIQEYADDEEQERRASDREAYEDMLAEREENSEATRYYNEWNQ